MNEGTNQAAPEVHRGVMYLKNPGKNVWDTHVGEKSTAGPTAPAADH
jgi:hypothetical protein